jgi:hypothetical protein
MIQLHPFKVKEGGEGRSPLGGQWKENEKVPFHLFQFSPQATLLRPSCFSFEIKVLFYHGYRSLFMRFFLFLWPINYDRAFWCQVPHTFIVDSISIWLKISSLFPWNYGIMYGHVLQALSYASEWRVGPIIFFKFYVDVTSSWWKP